MASPTSLKLDDELKGRVQHLAESRRRTSHWIMREAIAQYVEREEKREAFADVQRLYRFLTPKDTDAARRAVKAIRAGVKILAHQPRIGRPVEDMDPEFREWLIEFGNSGYVALYRLDAEAVSILSVRHQRRWDTENGDY
ncbi:type II toxin-antitoxin system RelE/ParE family toxin [Phyllobacterium sp. K27]